MRVLLACLALSACGTDYEPPLAEQVRLEAWQLDGAVEDICHRARGLGRETIAYYGMSERNMFLTQEGIRLHIPQNMDIHERCKMYDLGVDRGIAMSWRVVVSGEDPTRLRELDGFR